MYKNRNADGKLNVSGKKISDLRKNMIPKTSQKKLANMLQLMGLDLDKNAIQKMECGKRFITDIELKILAKVFNVSADFLLEEPKNNKLTDKTN